MRLPSTVHFPTALRPALRCSAVRAPLVRRRCSMTKPSRAKRIADLNDKFRKSPVTGGRTYMTAGVNSKGPEFVAKALIKVIAFADFTADNDPHGEHNFGSFELEGEQLFWKIDYYDLKAEFGSEDPTDPKKT